MEERKVQSHLQRRLSKEGLCHLGSQGAISAQLERPDQARPLGVTLALCAAPAQADSASGPQVPLHL